MKRTQSKQEKARYWTKVIEAARRNPAGVQAYCDEHGIDTRRYYYWFKMLRTEHPEWEDLKLSEIHRKKTKIQRAKQKPRKTEVEPKARRRKFTAKDKERILRETDAAAVGEVAAILRREGLYHATLQKWRQERTENGSAPKKPGRNTNSGDERVDKLIQRVAELEKQLKRKDLMLELQKKIAEILETGKESAG